MFRFGFRVPTLAVVILVNLIGRTVVQAQQQDTLPKFAPSEEQLAKLGEEYKDEHIAFRPPLGFKKVERDNPPELLAKGVASYAWSSTGEFPSFPAVSVNLTPFAQPTSENLAEMVDSMLTTMMQSLPEMKVVYNKAGKLGDTEVRIGKFLAKLNGIEITGLFLVGIDAKGTYSSQLMVESKGLTAEQSKQYGASLMSIHRPE